MSTRHCRRGRRCHSRTRNPDNTWTPGLVETPGLCQACEQTTFEAIRQLDGDYGALRASLTFKRRQGIPGPGGRGEHPIPINLAADFVANAIETEVLRWYRATASMTDADLPAHPRETVRRAHALLCTRLGTLIDKPLRRFVTFEPLPDGGDLDVDIELDGVDGVLRLADLHDDALKVLGCSETRTWLAEPCHVCGMKALSVTDDQQLIKCLGCRNVWSSEQFAALQKNFDYERQELRA